MLFKNTTKLAVEFVIRTSPDRNETFKAGPGETFEGPAAYADYFANSGCVEVKDVPANPPVKPKKGD